MKHEGRKREQSEGLTTPEAAAFIGLTPSAMRHLVERRKIPFRKLGKRILLRRSELLQFIEHLPGISVEEALKNE